MSKFGELIAVNTPVLLDFYVPRDESSASMHTVLHAVATALGNKGKVIKIDVEKNKELSQALRIKELPTLIIYKKGEMVWRQSGEQDAHTLLNLLNKYV